MLYDRMREYNIEVGVLEGKRNAVALHEGDIGDAMFLRKAHSRVGEPVDDIQTDANLDSSAKETATPPPPQPASRTDAAVPILEPSSWLRIFALR